MSTRYFAATVSYSRDKIKDAKLSCYFLLPVEAVVCSLQSAVLPARTQDAAPFALALPLVHLGVPNQRV